MKNKEIIKILNNHIKNYDVWTDKDLNAINVMKNCVNVLSDKKIYKNIS